MFQMKLEVPVIGNCFWLILDRYLRSLTDLENPNLHSYKVYCYYLA